MARTPAGRSRELVFRFVAERLARGEPPSVREVQHALGFGAVESARKHLEALVAAGRLVKTSGRARGYRLPGGPRRAPPLSIVPVLGDVRAGDLTLALQAPDGHVAVEGRRASEELFALTVRGESMTGEGIFPGDLVIVRRQPTARTGEIVVARVGDEATVKTYWQRGARIELRPANPAFRPIVPDGDDFAILGVVVELRRTWR